MFEVLIDDVWDGRIREEICENEAQVSEWIAAYKANDVLIRVYRNGQLIREV